MFSLLFSSPRSNFSSLWAENIFLTFKLIRIWNWALLNRFLFANTFFCSSIFSFWSLFDYSEESVFWFSYSLTWWVNYVLRLLNGAIVEGLVFGWLSILFLNDEEIAISTLNPLSSWEYERLLNTVLTAFDQTTTG